MRAPLAARAHSRLVSWLLISYDRMPNHPAKLRIRDCLEKALGNRRLAKKVRSGYWMALDRLDLIQRTLMAGEPWEPGLTALLSEEFTPDDVFWDAGANVGYFTLMALKREVRMVVSFEPDPLTASILKLNLQLNGWGLTDRIQVVEAALGDEEGEVPFGRAAATNTGMSAVGLDDAESVFMVRQTTLDRVLLMGEHRAPTILKIDVEGAEERVLGGADRLLHEKPPRLIVFEADTGSDGRLSSSTLAAILTSTGYDLSPVTGESHGGRKANFVARLQSRFHMQRTHGRIAL